MDLLIRNGTVVTDGTEMRADLAIHRGRVVAVGLLEGLEASETVDASGCVVLPGLVESASSLLAENDNWIESQQKPAELLAQAAQGGVTTIVFPAQPDIARPWSEQLDEMREALEKEAAIDFGFHYFVNALDPARLAHLRAALHGGAVSLWIARTPREASLPGTALLRATLRELPESATAFAPPCDPLFEDVLRRELLASGNIDATAQGSLFPHWAEAGYVRLAADFAATSRGRLVLAGLSCAASVRELMRLRNEGSLLVGAALLPHLVFNCAQDESDAEGNDDEAHLPVAWPPLRLRSDLQALWSALDSGVVQAVSAAHHPVNTAAATEAVRDAAKAPAGVGGIAHYLPLLYTEGVAKFRLAVESLSMAACADPAKLLGIYPRKGSLQPGSDADFVLLDPAESSTVTMSNGGLVNSYTGHPLQAAIRAVYLRGKPINTTEPHGFWLERRVSLA